MGNRLKTKDFDPLAYIESAFLDTESDRVHAPQVEGELDIQVGSLNDFMQAGPGAEPLKDNRKYRKTEMSAPRPRRSAKVGVAKLDPELQEVWASLPKNVEFLSSFFDDGVTANYYHGEFKETRQDLIRRLLDPQLSLEETSRLLGVCPATVRRYTNRNWLRHHRTVGGQRRFRLSDIVKFVETHGRFPEA